MSTKSESVAASDRIDSICATLCALIPIGVVLGTVVFEFFVCLAGVLWLGKCVSTRHNPVPAFKSHWVLIALLCFNLSIYLSVLVNGPGDKGLLNDLSFMRFFILAAALVDISHRIRIEKYLIFGLVSAVVLGAINTVSAHALGFDLLGKSFTRYAAKGDEAKRIAGLCTYAGAFFIAWSVFDRKLAIKHKIFLILLSLICVPLVIKTGIRTLIISLAAGVIWALFVFIKRRLSKVVALVLVLAAIGLSVFIVKSGNIHLSSFWDRLHIWKVNYAMWQKHPMVGVGPFAYRSQYREVMTNAEPGKFAFEAPDGTVYDHPEITFHAHSLLMMILTSTGIIGIAAFIGLFYLSCRTIHKYGEGWREGLLTWPIVLLCVGISGYNIYDPWYHSLFIFFLILIESAQKQPLLKTANLFEFKRNKTIAEASH